MLQLTDLPLDVYLRLENHTLRRFTILEAPQRFTSIEMFFLVLQVVEE